MDIYKTIQSALDSHKAGNLQQAELMYRKVLKKRPDDVDALHLLGVLYHQLGDYESAIKYIKKALKFDDRFAEAYNNLGNVIRDKGEIDEAEICYKRAIDIDPNFAIAHNNMGNIYTEKKQHDKAVVSFTKALQLNPGFYEAYNNMGKVLAEKNNHEEAISCFQKALQLNPRYANAYSNLGAEFTEKSDYDKAIFYYQRALQLNPDLAEAYTGLTFLMQKTCNWKELEVMMSKCDDLTIKALDSGKKTIEAPFMNIGRKDDPSMNFAVAESWSRDIAGTMAAFKASFSFKERRKENKAIIIGYLSNNFRNHAMAHLIRGLFGLHNRSEFQVYCFSYGKDDESDYREKIKNDCDNFYDICSLNDTDAARCIYEKQVDILVDLNGYTKGSRSAICALRPAPVQIRYLGFPGSSGSDFIDYIITDKIVTPEDQQKIYSEKFVYMPHCYQVNDNKQEISNKVYKKMDCGLPEGSFVFCSFNQPYKIDPVIFDIWIEIVKQVPGSVLWLGLSNSIARENLSKYAEEKGIQRDRLFFAETLPKNNHLSRLKIANLALDTRIVNGHITTSDALWAGVPVITLQGKHFASRASSSILNALGLPELITYSLDEYRSLAVRLARNPVELQEIRQKIDKNRFVEPLFDTPRVTRNLEKAYKEMWRIFLSGEAPRQIEVPEN